MQVNNIFFQSLQLKNDDDVYTMLMCNDQYSCVGPIELLCTIIRTPDAMLNLLQSTITPTHDAIMYYNGKWNIPRQGEFFGYSFTGTNPIRFGILSECGMEKLKDLIKQVAPTGVPLLRTPRRVECKCWKKRFDAKLRSHWTHPKGSEVVEDSIGFGRFEKTFQRFLENVVGFFEVFKDVVGDVSVGFCVFWKVLDFRQWKVHEIDIKCV